jgi:hypothetical protein
MAPDPKNPNKAICEVCHKSQKKYFQYRIRLPWGRARKAIFLDFCKICVPEDFKNFIEKYRGKPDRSRV